MTDLEMIYVSEIQQKCPIWLTCLYYDYSKSLPLFSFTIYSSAPWPDKTQAEICANQQQESNQYHIGAVLIQQISPSQPDQADQEITGDDGSRKQPQWQ